MPTDDKMNFLFSVINNGLKPIFGSANTALLVLLNK